MTKIAHRTVGCRGLSLSELGFGGATLANLFRVVPAGAGHQALKRAFRAGMTYVDTAPYYGGGLSERRVGDAVRDEPGVVISTKVGRLLKPQPLRAGEWEREGFWSPLPFEAVYDYSYDGVMRSWEASLHRLGLAAVDILFVHDIGVATHGAANDHYMEQLIGGGFRALTELRDGGAIRAFGLGVNEWQVCLEIMQHVRLDVILLAGRYSLLDHESALRNFMPVCARDNTALVLGGVYSSGILATGTQSRAPLHFNYAPATARVVEQTRLIERVCGNHEVPLRAAAIQFALAGPAVGSVILGLADEAEVEQALSAYRCAIPSAFWDELRALGLIAADAPVPIQRT